MDCAIDTCAAAGNESSLTRTFTVDNHVALPLGALPAFAIHAPGAGGEPAGGSAPPGDANAGVGAVKRVAATIAGGFKKSGRRHTIITKLRLRGIPAGAAVEVLCSGGGCPFTRRAPAATNGVARLTELFNGSPLANGATIEIRITQPGAIGQVVRFKMRRRRAPARTTLCLPVGSSTPSACS